ncbi:hypothetical protein Tco_0675099 [Tanacetum coccineum]
MLVRSGDKELLNESSHYTSLLPDRKSWASPLPTNPNTVKVTTLENASSPSIILSQAVIRVTLEDYKQTLSVTLWYGKRDLGCIIDDEEETLLHYGVNKFFYNHLNIAINAFRKIQQPLTLQSSSINH